jgi:hypothetical protein
MVSAEGEDAIITTGEYRSSSEDLKVFSSVILSYTARKNRCEDLVRNLKFKKCGVQPFVHIFQYQ